MTPWRCCVQLHLTSHLCWGNSGVINWEGSLICHILNTEVCRLSCVHFVRAQSLFDNLISGAACCGKYRAVSLRMEVSCRQTETSVGKETGGCARLTIISSCQPAYALKKPCDAHLHAKPRARTFSSHASEWISTTFWCPLLLPSVSFFPVFLCVSCELIYVGFRTQHVRLDLPSFCSLFPILSSLFTSCSLHYKSGRWTFWTPLVFMVWSNPQRQKEREREVERWGTQGPVRTRRHCVAPQLCRTDSLHYSTLQQPAPQSSANLLLTGPSS